MKLLILAAGEGKRLRPHTKNKPKCMVPYDGKPIIDYILDATKSIEDRNIVSGYKSQILKEYLKDEKITFFKNDDFAKTNMVYSMLQAKEIFNDDIIVSYSDIIYPAEFIEKLLKNKDEIAVVADINWLNLWKKRFDNVLDDCETFKYNQDLYLYEIGQKGLSSDETMAGYVGLIKFSNKILSEIQNMKIEPNMYMTDLLQILCSKYKIKVVLVDSTWLEIDDIRDLQIKI